MSTDPGLWEFEVASGRFTWTFPDGVPFTDLDEKDRIRLREVAQLAAESASPVAICEELRVGDPDEASRWLAVYGRRLSEAGPCERVGGVVIDVSESRRDAYRTQLVVDEFRHRARNAFSIIQSIVAQTLRNTSCLAEAQSALTGRLVAFSRNQTLLSEAYWTHATVHSVIAETLSFQAGGDRIALSGPAVGLAPDYAAGLSMLVHELATNALKYGALSSEAGRIEVSWTFDGDPTAIRLEWREACGPPVTPPSRAGFGTRLIRAALRRPAAVGIDFDPAGVVCTVSGLPTVAATSSPR
jgi:two-component sensor histidine kinase